MKLTEITVQLNKDVEQYNDFLILPHVMADGDAIGCALAVGYYLKRRNKKVKILLEENLAYIYKFMDNSDIFEVFDSTKQYNCDVCIAVDTGDLNRLGKRKDLFSSCRSYNIDHHKTNNEYAVFNHVDTRVSSTGEIIYDMLHYMKLDLGHDIAQALYVAIATDTGGFRYQNTNKKCFQIASDLMDYGIDIEKISDCVFERTNMSKLHLLKRTIQNIEFYCDGKVAVSTIRKREFDDMDVQDEDFEGLVNTVRNIDGVEIGVFIRQRNVSNEVKASLRSNTDTVDVAKIAMANGGGGHARAAGIVSNLSIDQLKRNILNDLEKFYLCME